MIAGDDSTRRTIAIAVFVLSVLVYFNTLFSQFTNWDDTGMVLDNRFIVRLTLDRVKAMFTPGATGSYQPLRDLSYAIDYHFWRHNPLGYHLANVILFALNSVLVFYILLPLFKDVYTALAASLLFAVHPIHAEAVAWVAGRKEVLAGAFFLGAFALYVSAVETEQRRPAHYAGALVLFLCALWSKATSVTLPALLILYDVCFLKGITFKKMVNRWRVHVPFWALTLIAIWINMRTAMERGTVKEFVGGKPFYTMLTMATVFVDYVRMLFVPVGLRARYLVQPVLSVTHPGAWCAVAAILVLVVLGIARIRKSPGVSFSILWFLITLLPVSNIIPLSTLKADRYLYLPSVGFCMLIALFFRRIGVYAARGTVPRWRARTAQACFSIVLVAFSVLTIRRNADWKDSITIWNVDLEAYPQSVFALNNLGLAYADLGDNDKAVRYFESALQIMPDFSEAYANLGNVYFDQNKFEDSERCYKKALSLEPRMIGLHNSLGMVYERLGRYDEAVGAYRQCLTLDPNHAEAHANLGFLLYRMGQFTDAVKELEQAIDIKPDDFESVNNLGVAYCKVGRFADAIRVHRDALKLRPDSASAHYNLANALAFSGGLPQAESEYLKAIQLATDPEKKADAYGNLGSVYVQMGLFDKAADSFKKALELNPALAKVHYNIGAMYESKGDLEQAISAYRKAMQQEKRLAIPVHMSIANIYATQNKLEEAKRDLEEVLKLDPTFGPARQALDSLKEAQKKRDSG